MPQDIHIHIPAGANVHIHIEPEAREVKESKPGEFPLTVPPDGTVTPTIGTPRVWVYERKLGDPYPMYPPYPIETVSVSVPDYLKPPFIWYSN